MANTYTQLYVQVVFAVKYRNASLHASWRPELYKYIVGLIEHRNHKVYAIGGSYDHLHILISMNASQSLSELIMEIKRASTLWIKKKEYVRTRFAWQEGYGAFSYGQSQIPNVINYIQNQQEHHSKHTFQDEYRAFLELFQVEYNDKYIFSEPK